MSETDSVDGEATRVVLSYPMDLGPHGERRIKQDYYRTYLAKVKEEAYEGDAWDEFTDVGCCGSQMDVPLVVVEVEGGPRVTEDTVIEYVEREACNANPGWSVQHADPEHESDIVTSE